MEEGFIVHAFERSRSGRMEIDLVGRLANGETFAVSSWPRTTMDGAPTLRVDFDFQALHRRFGDLGVPLDIGRSDSPATFLDRPDPPPPVEQQLPGLASRLVRNAQDVGHVFRANHASSRSASSVVSTEQE